MAIDFFSGNLLAARLTVQPTAVKQFQHDGAPTHASHREQWRISNRNHHLMSNYEWPSNFNDPNPVDQQISVSWPQDVQTSLFGSAKDCSSNTYRLNSIFASNHQLCALSLFELSVEMIRVCFFQANFVESRVKSPADTAAQYSDPLLHRQYPNNGDTCQEITEANDCFLFEINFIVFVSSILYDLAPAILPSIV